MAKIDIGMGSALLYVAGLLFVMLVAVIVLRWTVFRGGTERVADHPYEVCGVGWEFGERRESSDGGAVFCGPLGLVEVPKSE